MIELSAFALGIIVNAFWVGGYFSNGKPLPPAALVDGAATSRLEEALPRGWPEVYMIGKVAFFVPPDVKSYPTDVLTPYRAFYREGLEVSTAYTYAPYSVVCRQHADDKFDKAKVARTKVAGREATILHGGRAAYGTTDDSYSEPLGGLTVCVPDTGDGRREFTIVVRYKTGQDYQDAVRIIDSVRFP
jgi:hypothetical protein